MSNSATETGSRLRGAIASLSPKQRRHALWLTIAIGSINALGFFMLLGLVVPQHLALQSGGVFGIGLGLTAYTLGIRHAFDADHIAAIDNTTRKLMGEGTDSLSVGFFFSLGHSTIVIALGALVAVGVRGIAGMLENDSSTLHLITGTWGPAVAGIFLLLVGTLNLIVLVNIGRVFHRMRGGELDEQELERQLENRGVMNRCFKHATRSITDLADVSNRRDVWLWI